MSLDSRSLPHRAMRSYKLRWSIVARDVLVTVALTGLLWWALRYVAIAWVAQLNFWIVKTGLTGHAEIVPANPADDLSLIPAFAVSALTMLPSLETWWITAIGCAAVWIASVLVSKQRLPLIYTLRLLVFVQLSALVFFYMWPDSIPTTVATFLTDVFRQSAGLMLLVPSLFALTLYLFALPWWAKFGATLSALLFLLLFVPLQAACEAWILQMGGILFMPTLFLFFGLLPQVVALMGIYSFFLSLLPGDEELSRRGSLKH
jgi:hypothetical protein